MAFRFGRILAILVGLGVVGVGGFLYVTQAQPYPDAHWANLGEPDLANGALVFSAGGCVSCHGAVDATGDAKLVLAGGLPLHTAFGTFYAPNISPDEEAGIGGWSLSDFGNAIKRGVDDEGKHLYPSFPYGSYARMSDKDVNDLWAYMKTLPKSANVAPDHDLPFPLNIRLSIGGWKFLNYNENPRVTLADSSDAVKRGQYLVEGPGHCGECHTPRDAIGGFVSGKWLAGAPNPEGKGNIPNITPGSKDIASWSEDDIVTYLETGMTPDGDFVGGSMADVQQNMAKLPAEDRKAIAAYLKAIPSVM
jgi:mono/diheme cytochrome c family protein